MDFADYVLDTGAPLGDAMVRIDHLDTPLAPGSSIGGIALINSLKVQIASVLMEKGKRPKVLSSGTLIGQQRASDILEAAYDEHARLMAKLNQNLGKDQKA